MSPSVWVGWGKEEDSNCNNIFITAPEKQYHYPELFSHTISSGDKLYGMVFKPHDLQMGVKYPVILSVYGGPEVQLVSNTFKGKANKNGTLIPVRVNLRVNNLIGTILCQPKAELRQHLDNAYGLRCNILFSVHMSITHGFPLRPGPHRI